MKKWSLIIFLLLPFIGKTQTITTFAGMGIGSAGYSGDGGPATAAHIGGPSGGAFDASGNYYITSGGSNRVRKVSAAGIITTVAGTGTVGFSGDGGPATAAQLNWPTDIALDTSGNIYIADEYNYRIRKIDVSTGIITTFAGNGINGFSGDGGLGSMATFSNSAYICFDRLNNLYISDPDNQRVRRVNSSGIITTVAGNGNHGYTSDGGLADTTTLTWPLGITCDSSGNLYIVDGGYRIRKVDASTGIITTFAGDGIGWYNGEGISANSAGIAPYDIHFDAFGNLYIADYGNQRLRKIGAEDGTVITIAGTGTPGFSGDGGPATAAQIYNPEGIAVDACGNVYDAETQNARIRKVTFPGNAHPPGITISTAGSYTVCAGASIIYTSTVTGAIAPVYQWHKNGAVVSTGSTYTYSPVNGDSIRCVLISTDPCSGAADTVSSNKLNMVVTPLTIPAISITGIASVHIGAMVTVTATVTNAGSSYTIKWFNNGILFSTTAVPTVTYTKAAGTDNITARVIPSAIRSTPGCYDSVTSAVHTVSLTTGINTITAERLHIYPNPAKDMIHIAGVDNTVASMPAGQPRAVYRLLSIIGIVLQQGNLTEGDNSISIQSLPVGIYIIEVSGNDREKIIKRVVKE